MPITLNQNLFISTISNLIIYTKYYNQFRYGRGISRFLEAFRSDDVERGDGVVIRTAEVLTPKDLNIEASSLLEINKPVISEQYIPVSAFKVIPLTLNEEIMRMSFSEEYALSNFMGYLMSLLQITKEISLYNEISGVITQALADASTTGITSVNVTGFEKETSNATAVEENARRTANANALYRAIMRVVSEASIGSYQNGLGDTIYTTPENLVLLIPSAVLATLDVDTLATLLNSSVISNGINIDIIPWEFGKHKQSSQSAIADTTCMLLDKEAVQYGFKYQLSTSFFDSSNLNTNYWNHYAYYAAYVNGAFGVALNVTNMFTE